MMKKIVVKNLSKKFYIGFKKNQSALMRFLNFFSTRPQKKLLTVLRNISFELNSGEILGVIGSNGSGKSTLLRILSGIYDCDSGEVFINGKVISLIGLGNGMQGRLTLRENVFLVGSLFGMGQDELIEKLDSIVQFAELGEFIQTPLYQFSSGMLQRLAFSIGVHTNPDILLLDEVFEVGDESFKKKSAEKIKEMAQGGTSVIFVSHELWRIEKYCDAVIWIDKGEIAGHGKSKEIVKRYQASEI